MIQRNQRLAGKVGIVVGGGQTAGDTVGNGRAAAIVFARAGARLLVVDANLVAAQATADLIATEGSEVCAFRSDWTESVACEAFVALCVALWGRVDFLHNNAGVLGTDTDPALPSEVNFNRVWRTNLIGCLNACQAVLPSMRRRGEGSIVNISSVAAVAPTGLLSYRLSKTAMNAPGRELAMLNAPHGIRVNTVMPDHF